MNLGKYAKNRDQNKREIITVEEHERSQRMEAGNELNSCAFTSFFFQCRPQARLNGKFLLACSQWSFFFLLPPSFMSEVNWSTMG